MDITAGTIYTHPKLGNVTALLDGVSETGDAVVHRHEPEDTLAVPADQLTLESES